MNSAHVFAILQKHRKSLIMIGWIVLGTLFVAEVVISILYRQMYIDEFFAAYRSYTIFTGDLIPFVNGVFPYPPLVIPTYGLVQYLFGPSIFAGRIFSATLFAGIIALTYIIAKKLSGRLAGILSVLLILSNFLLVSNYTTQTMYALAVILLLFLVYVETLESSPRLRFWGVAVLSALLVLCRTNMVVVPLLYALYLFSNKISIRWISYYLASVLCIVALGYLPIIVHNPEVALGHILSPFFNYGAYVALPASSTVGSHTALRFLEILTDFIKEYYGFILVFITLTTTVLFEVRHNFVRFVQKEKTYFFILILSVGFIISHYFYWRIVGSVYYASYFMPLIAISIAIAATKYLRHNKLALLMIGFLILCNYSANMYRTDLYSDPRVESDLERVYRGALFIQKNTNPDSKILVFDNSLFHMFLADRRTYSPLVNRDFLFWANKDTETVRMLGFYNLEMLKEWTAGADYLMLHREKWSESFIRKPFWGKGDEDAEKRIKEIRAIIDTKYILVDRVLNVYPRKYTEGNDGGTLELYKRVK